MDLTLKLLFMCWASIFLNVLFICIFLRDIFKEIKEIRQTISVTRNEK